MNFDNDNEIIDLPELKQQLPAYRYLLQYSEGTNVIQFHRLSFVHRHVCPNKMSWK